jgi:hypothetical protein
MDNISQSLKKNISEIKEKKSDLIIEHSIVQSRLKFVLEQEYISEKHLVVSYLSEIIHLEEQGYNLTRLNEEFDLFGVLGGFIGGGVSAIPEVMKEYIVDAVAKLLGIQKTSYFYNIVKNTIASTPIAEFPKLLTSCQYLTNRISDSLIESIITTKQAQTGYDNNFLNLIRNAIVTHLTESKNSVIQKLQDLLLPIICDAVTKWRENIKNLGKEWAMKLAN